LTPEGQVGAADKEDSWTIGSKFKSSANGLSEDISGRPARPRGDMAPPKEIPGDDSDWRSSARQAKPVPGAHSSISPTSSTPPTPQLARRKLELLPKSGNASVTPSPLSSPKMGPTAPVSQSSRPNPFGAARPVDVSSRDKEVAERIERERGATHEKLAMSRSSSRTGIERGVLARPQTPPVSASAPSKPLSSKGAPTLVPTVRPTLSFANVAAKKEAGLNKKEQDAEQITEVQVEQIPEEVGKVVL